MAEGRTLFNWTAAGCLALIGFVVVIPLLFFGGCAALFGTGVVMSIGAHEEAIASHENAGHTGDLTGCLECYGTKETK